MGRHTNTAYTAVHRAPGRAPHLWAAGRRLLRAVVVAALAVVLVAGPETGSRPATSVEPVPAAAALRAHCTDWAGCRDLVRAALRVLAGASASRAGRPALPSPSAAPSTAPSTAPAAAPTTTAAPTGTATPSATTDSRLVRYAPTDEVFANPERGFYHYTETHWSPDGSAYAPLDVARLTAWRTTESVSLVYRVFYLDGLVDRDAVDQRFLDQVAGDLRAARAAGVQLVVRFAYSADSGRDAPPARAVGHVRQLAPVLNAGADVVFVLQAGFVGRWGEWYYSDSYTSDPSRPWELTDADWASRDRVLDALLDSTSPGIWVQVRYPAISQRLLGSGDPRAARVGVHNDCFLASDTDMGTLNSAAERTWLADRSRTRPVGGETCGANAPRSLWETAAAELARYHWSFLNADYSRDVLDSWGPSGRTTAARLLGYRLSLTSATLPGSARAGATVPVELTLTNQGWAAPLSARPVQLVLRAGTQTVAVPVPLDVRTLAPGTTRTVRVDVPVPAAPGVWAVSLALPDAAPALAGDPAYAIRLANQGLWDPVTGRNDLGHAITVR
ncbi:DUF4832 domain-containing protein [Blastococcus sp. SYSU D00813]